MPECVVQVNTQCDTASRLESEKYKKKYINKKLKMLHLMLGKKPLREQQQARK